MSYYVNPHQFSCPWHPYSQEFGAPSINWCEAIQCGLTSQPANSFSSLSYILVALILSFYASRKVKDQDTELLLRILFISGFFSVLYHASLNYITQLLDFVGIFALGVWAIGINLKKQGKINNGNKFYYAGGMTVLFTVVTHIFYLKQVYLYVLFIVLAGFFILSEIRVKDLSQKNYKYLGMGSVLILISGILTWMDYNQITCSPQNHILQMQALAHIFSAIGLGSLYLHLSQHLEDNVKLEETLESDFSKKEIKIEEEIETYEPQSKLEPLQDSKVSEPNWETRESEDITAEHEIAEIMESDSEAESKIDPTSDLEDEIDPNQLDLFGDENSEDSKKE